MEYMTYQLWPMLLLSLIMGCLFGYYTCGAGDHERDKRD
jgi:hypothetical protein